MNSINKYCNFDKYPQINTYDIAKIIAILAMILDHLGLYFYPEVSNLRIIGRISFPIFFFLIGYQETSKPYDFKILLLGLISSLIQHQFGHMNKIFNVLVSAFIVKIFIIKIVKKSNLDLFQIIFTTVFLTVMFPVSKYLFEYGSLAMLYGFFGYLVRINYRYKSYYLVFMIFASSLPILFNAARIDIISLYMILSAALSITVMYFFKIKDLKVKGAIRIFLAIVSRQAALLYFVHLVAFIIYAHFKHKSLS